MTKQKYPRYTALVDRMALILLVMCVLIYLSGRFIGFTRTLFILADGYNITADIVFLLIDCVVNIVIMCIVPIKVFNYFHWNAFREKCMPVEQKILSRDLIAPVFILGLCLTYVVALINNYIGGVIKFADLTGLGEEYLFLSGMKYGYQIIIYLISIAVIPAIVEELVFRKTFCDALAPYGAKTAIIITSVLFALMHRDFARVIFTFVMGVFCSWLYIGTKNIKIPMLLHFLNNLLAGIETVIWYRVSQEAYSTVVIARFILFAIISVACFVYIMSKREGQKYALIRELRESGEYDAYIEKKAKYKRYIEMLPDENGEEVQSLSVGERIKGFFTPLTVVFIVLIIIQMFYHLSFRLV